MGTIDISYFNLLIGLLLLVIPLFYLWKFKTGLLKATLIGTARMIVQLFLIGMYLKYLFLWNNPWINFLWVIIMIFVAGQTALVRTGLKREILLIPISVGFLCSVVLVGMYFIGIVLQLDNVFSAQYFIPIFGILMGNMLSSNVIALNTYYSGLKREQQLPVGQWCHSSGSTGTIHTGSDYQIFQPTDCQYRGYGISSTSRHDDRANFGRQQSERCHKISNDDYGHYFHSLYVIINDHHLAGIP